MNLTIDPGFGLTKLCQGRMGEIERSAKKLWKLTKGVLLIVEDGTSEGFATVEAARRVILSQEAKRREEGHVSSGSHVLAPCPHDGPCPLAALGRRCSFSQRMNHPAVESWARGDSRRAFKVLFVTPRFAVVRCSHRLVTCFTRTRVSHMWRSAEGRGRNLRRHCKANPAMKTSPAVRCGSLEHSTPWWRTGN